MQKHISVEGNREAGVILYSLLSARSLVPFSQRSEVFIEDFGQAGLVA